VPHSAWVAGCAFEEACYLMIFDNCIEKSHLISAEQCSVTFMERAPCEERRMRHPQRGIAIEGILIFEKQKAKAHNAS
jgi:hypothetical protein